MAPESDFADRLPPHNREAEQSVLGSMLKNNHVIGDVILIVRKDDFYTDAHQKIFETIVALNDKGGQPVDLIILHEALKQREYIEDAGGSPYLAELWDAVPSAANVEYYAHIVREKALLRNLIHAGNEILGDAYKQVMPADEMVAAAEKLDPRGGPEGHHRQPAHARRGHRRDLRPHRQARRAGPSWPSAASRPASPTSTRSRRGCSGRN